ncbi:hypothetical protein [Gracilibacillus alcaliphilus]|uniref:hypothetical protein n=1 Tax=Gracilibacillus alcaliphilus TaxID=1401441 RepID=UPI00195C5B57|nr:hypothetical protein [Gracilibacillus alcaliphilus]MBM7676435.1 hypothetical protein [Gracilibacillus alcaliphilus]
MITLGLMFLSGGAWVGISYLDGKTVFNNHSIQLLAVELHTPRTPSDQLQADQDINSDWFADEAELEVEEVIEEGFMQEDEADAFVDYSEEEPANEEWIEPETIAEEEVEQPAYEASNEVVTSPSPPNDNTSNSTGPGQENSGGQAPSEWQPEQDIETVETAPHVPAGNDQPDTPEGEEPVNPENEQEEIEEEINEETEPAEIEIPAADEEPNIETDHQ